MSYTRQLNSHAKKQLFGTVTAKKKDEEEEGMATLVALAWCWRSPSSLPAGPAGPAGPVGLSVVCRRVINKKYHRSGNEKVPLGCQKHKSRKFFKFSSRKLSPSLDGVLRRGKESRCQPKVFLQL